MIDQLHFILIPLMSPGHIIPMVDIARLLAKHGTIATIVTTPLNATNFSAMLARDNESGINIRILELRFPAIEFGLPEGCESMDKLPSRDLIRNFFDAANKLQEQFEQVFDSLSPRPSCIISGKNLPWTVETAHKFGIPRIFFDGMGCFAFSCIHHLQVSGIHERLGSNSEPFLVPGIPHQIELTRAKLPEGLSCISKDLTDVRDKIRAVEFEADGIVINTFEELETEYVNEFKRVKGNRVWCIGPVSGYNKLVADKAQRGSQASINENECLQWLDAWEPESVIYACLGSISGLTPTQLMELALGLEDSNQPFIWVIRKGKNLDELEHWIEENGFERRTKDRGLLIRGWSPQLLILSHSSVGGFLTHCGWNSTLEGMSSGVPIIACPLFAEQFINEKFIVEVLRVGVSAGVEAAVMWGHEDKSGLVIKREGVKAAIKKLMEKTEEGDERRKRAKELRDAARIAIEEGGSSYVNIKMLIQYVLDYSQHKQAQGANWI